MSNNTAARAKPFINVTPLIDVLLVMLIIFMVVSPLKPHSFSAQLPSPPDNRDLVADPHTLVVTIRPDRTLQLNRLPDDMGTIEDSSKLRGYLVSLFNLRRANHAYRDDMIARPDVPEELRIQKTVFIKAPRAIPYGLVMKVMDDVKGTGANPVGLQLDNID
jgi:biopolymer transport protein ExbD